MSKVFKADAECHSCGGTGLYSGFAERDGCAVVCVTCKGTGCEKISINYTPFEKRKERRDIKRVFKSSCGYGHSADTVTTQEGKVVRFDLAGVTYKDWLAGGKPKPVKELYCPYIWTSQGLQQEKNPQHKLYEERCEEALKLGSIISNCKLFPEKAKCWKRYEELGGE